CDIEIPDPRVSSRHALIMVEGDKVEFVDQNSTNGVYIDGQRMRKGRWPDGATVFMGGTEMRLRGGAARDLSARTATSEWGVRESATFSAGPAINDASFDFNIVQEKKIGGEAPGDAAQPGLEDFAKRMRVINRMIKSVTATFTIPDLLDRTMTLLF